MRIDQHNRILKLVMKSISNELLDNMIEYFN